MSLMSQKRYSVIVVPDDQGRVKQVDVSSRQLRTIVVSLLLLLALTSFFALQYIGRAHDAAAMSQLREENAYLWSRVADLDSSISLFQDQMASLVEKEKMLRTMADLPPIDSDVRKVGVGGHSATDVILSSDPLRIEERSPDLALSDVDRLLRQAKLEKQSLLEVESGFRDHAHRLQHTPTIWPVRGHISRGFGKHTDPFTGQLRQHDGLDIVNRVGTAVVATADGKVIQKGWQNDYGWMVVIDHGYGYQTAYGHLDSIVANKGERVQRGQTIATLGNSGRSTGPHLHYEVRVNGSAVNPYRYILPEVIVD
jgi:murein DD-endopeptidase MepM/ murein hydrolase activator NlpD